jgi:hypothetical protein
MKISEAEKYCMYPQGVCRIRKPAYAGNGYAIFPAFETAQLGKRPAAQPKSIDSGIPK